MEIVALTTVDNPYDPIDDFDRWYSTDLQLAIANHRRDTCSMLALFSYCSENLSEKSSLRLTKQKPKRAWTLRAAFRLPGAFPV